jgi:hypothetical protein
MIAKIKLMLIKLFFVHFPNAKLRPGLALRLIYNLTKPV